MLCHNLMLYKIKAGTMKSHKLFSPILTLTVCSCTLPTEWWSPLGATIVYATGPPARTTAISAATRKIYGIGICRVGRVLFVVGDGKQLLLLSCQTELKLYCYIISLRIKQLGFRFDYKYQFI